MGTSHLSDKKFSNNSRNCFSSLKFKFNLSSFDDFFFNSEGAKIVNNSPTLLERFILEFSIKYNSRIALGIPDTSVLVEGDKVYIYKVDKKDITKRTEIEIGNRSQGYLEVKSGLNNGDTIVAEGLKKVRPNGKIRPIKDGAKKSKSSWGGKNKSKKNNSETKKSKFDWIKNIFKKL